MFRFLIAITLLVLSSSIIAQATHLRAGEITVVRKSCAGLTFIITVTVYTDSESTVPFGGRQSDGLDVLDFGDGIRIIIPETPSVAKPELGANIAVASFTTEHTYGGSGRYLISYKEPNRNGGVLNMVNSILTTFYIETEINTDAFYGCNNSPKLLIAPVDKGCTGVAFQHNPGAFDPDGDSLSYEMVIPFRDRNTVVTGYRDPNNSGFYTGNFDTANENQNGPPTFSINPITGTITWDAPGIRGEYNIAFNIVEWREIAGQWVEIGYVRRDMQIIIDECDNERPDLIIPNDTCVVAGTTLNVTIFGIDIDNNNVKIEAFSELFGDTFISPAKVSPNPAVFQSVVPDPAELTFEWETVCEHVKDQPYQVVFKITDNGQPNLVTFKTWFVKVVGPAPEWNLATVDFAKRHVKLDWDEYTCKNASSIQVWRRVDSFAYTPANCETGLSPGLGYEMIALVPASSITYTDTNGGLGLAVGAEYCYRLVALFPLPRGGESYMSEELCIAPILADAPVITHVTVEKTGESDGQIRVSWRKPFEIDPVQFPPPYQYKVWRSEGFTGAKPWVAISSGTISDTTAIDNAINTLDKIYSYHVELYSATINNPAIAPVDTSATASMVRLDVQSGDQRLDLSWQAFTPWSNLSQNFPLHDVYRGAEGSTETAGLVLYQQVNVSVNGFIFSDPGETAPPLVEDEVYCYRVMTRGTYGNPAIDEPLENYSQIICAQAADEEPPVCVPSPVLADIRSCEEFFADQSTCNINTFSNEVRWNRVTTTECEGDVLGYRVYVANEINGEFQPILINGQTFTRDTVFVDNNLTSFARCYKISVVDRSGNESELSESICNDNCPYYELPNVFTPNGDGCNDFFSAYSNREGTGEESPNPSSLNCQPAYKERCARFVEKVLFRVYNRWGVEVYTYESVLGDDVDKTIYIDWDGRDNSGTLLNSGVYYYAADVTFNVINPDNRVQTIKGWVHLIR
ncbi:gliding motility-associated C-terminal domain-containing protein [Chryseotalea sanaruensis]|nr:gliding motility-associated C-terminal domain-containing protein [Chryseotalea sanaruensis]